METIRSISRRRWHIYSAYGPESFFDRSPLIMCAHCCSKSNRRDTRIESSRCFWRTPVARWRRVGCRMWNIDRCPRRVAIVMEMSTNECIQATNGRRHQRRFMVNISFFWWPRVKHSMASVICCCCAFKVKLARREVFLRCCAILKWTSAICFG